MRNIFLSILTIALFACNTSTKKASEPVKKEDAQYKLELVWASDTLVKTPESVLIDRARDILYVSCVNMNPWEKDGNGFISKMGLDGKIIDLEWVSGLDGPKGMGLSGNSLFVADINTLVEINIETGEIVNRIEVEGKPDLNDITVGKDGTVYVSGSGSNTIYQLDNGALTEVYTGNEGERFNGLYKETDRMLLVTSQSSLFKSINWETKETKIISENMGHGDAIAPVGDGGYITTSWKGVVYYVSSSGEVIELLNTEAIEENAADADFSTKNQILYVPTFFKNQVKAYKLVK